MPGPIDDGSDMDDWPAWSKKEFLQHNIESFRRTYPDFGNGEKYVDELVGMVLEDYRNSYEDELEELVRDLLGLKERQ